MQPSPNAPQTSQGKPAAEHRQSIVERVAELTHLSPDEAMTALRTVLCIFEQRLSGGEARKVEIELGHLLELAHEECFREDDEQAELFDRSEFFSRAATRLPGGGLETGRIAAAVLAAIRERMSDRLAAEVGNQMPADIRALWDEPLPQEVALPPITNLHHNKSRTIPLTELAAAKPNHSRISLEKFLAELAKRAALSEPDAESASVAVLWFLARRIPAPVSEKLSEQLPREIQIQLQDALLHGGNVPDWELGDYYDCVARQLGISKPRVVPLVHHVFDLVRGNVPAEIVQKVGSELPASMKDTWLATPFSR